MKSKRYVSGALLMLALMLLAHGTKAQAPQTSTSSVKSSLNLATRATSACNAAVDELIASRKLIEALEAENAGLKTSLETTSQLNSALTELNNTRKSESDALRNALAAKNETIAAKDAVIASQDKLIAELKRKKPSVWQRLGDILLGAGVIAVLK